MAVVLATSAPALFVCWVIFVGTFDKWEMLIGVFAALVGGAALVVVELAEDAHFRPRLRDWLQAVYIPWLVVQDTYRILLVSLRDLLGGKRAQSLFRLLPFDAGALHDPHDTGRRVLACAYTTMAPNSIVLGINPRDRWLLFHQIEKSGIPQMTKNLGGEA